MNGDVNIEHEGQIGVIFASGSHQLIGTLFLAADNGPKPTALLLHGCPGFEKNHDIAYMLRERGWNSLVFHYRGCWGSEGDYTFQTIPEDVCAAMDELTSGRYPQIDPARLVLVGSSLGGWAAVITAACDLRPRAVAVYGPAVQLGGATIPADVIETDFAPWLRGVTPTSFANQVEALDEAYQPLQQVAKIAPRPLLIINGDKDPWTPVAGAEALYAAAGEPRQLQVISGGNHYLSWHRAELCEQLWVWLSALKI